MVRVEQHGSSTFFLKELPVDRPLERYEVVELMRQLADVTNIDPEEYLSPYVLEQLKSCEEEY